jgi:hypothetical protein
MAGEAGFAVTVREQVDNAVVVEIPMAGFPEGFRLHAGDKVMVVNDDNGPSARPLVKVVAAESDDGAELRSAHHRYAISDAAVRIGGERGGRRVAFVVERDQDDGQEQIIATRPLA